MSNGTTSNGTMPLPDPPVDTTLLWYEYIVFAVIVIFHLGVRVLQGLKSEDSSPGLLQQFFCGGRTTKIFPAAMPLSLTFISVVEVIGGSARVYTNGSILWLVGIGWILGSGLVALFLVPVLHPLEVTSLNEYLKRRYRKPSASIAASLCFLLLYSFYAGVSIYTASIAIKTVTGFDIVYSMLVTAGVAALCSIISRCHSAVYSDMVHVFLLTAVCVFIIVKGSLDVDGMSVVWQKNKEMDRINFLQWEWTPYMEMSTWSSVFGFAVVAMALLGVHLPEMKICRPDVSFGATLGVALLSGPWFLLVTTLFSLCGLVMFSWYHHNGCDPVMAGSIQDNQIMPYYVMDRLNFPVIPGIFLATIAAGGVGVASASIQKAAVYTYEDIFRPMCEGSKTTCPTRFTALLFGGAAFGFAMLCHTLEGNILMICIRLMSAALGPLLGQLLLGILFPCSNSLGSTVGCLSGLGVSVWVCVGYFLSDSHPTSPIRSTVANCTFLDSSVNTDAETERMTSGLDTFYQISVFYVAGFAMAVTIVIGFLVSCFSGCENKEMLDEDTVLPVCVKCKCGKRSERRSPDEANIYQLETSFQEEDKGTKEKEHKKENGEFEKFKLGRNFSSVHHQNNLSRNTSNASTKKSTKHDHSNISERSKSSDIFVMPLRDSKERLNNKTDSNERLTSKVGRSHSRRGEELDSSWVFSRGSHNKSEEAPSNSFYKRPARNNEEVSTDFVSLSVDSIDQRETCTDEQIDEMFHPVTADDPEFDWMFKNKHNDSAKKAKTDSQDEERSNWVLKTPTRSANTRHSYAAASQANDDETTTNDTRNDWKRSKSAPKQRREGNADDFQPEWMSLFQPNDAETHDLKDSTKTPPKRSIMPYKISDNNATYASVLPSHLRRSANKKEDIKETDPSAVPPTQFNPLKLYSFPTNSNIQSSHKSSDLGFRVSDC